MTTSINWTVLALCSKDSADPDLWLSERRNLQRVAIRVCDQCPVKMTCREEAIERGVQYGVWGGLVMQDERPEPESKLCKHGHDQSIHRKLVGGSERCEPCYTRNQRVRNERARARRRADRDARERKRSDAA